MKKLLTIIALLMVFVVFAAKATTFALSVENGVGNGDLVTIGENVNIDEPTNGEVVIIFGNAEINKDVNGQVVVIGGDLIVNAKISGEVVNIMGSTTLTENAEIMGNLVSMGSFKDLSDGKIHGQKTVLNIGDFKIGNFNMNFLVFLQAILLILYLFITIALGMPMIAIASRWFRKMTAGVSEGVRRKLALGFLGLLGSFIAMLLFCWTMVIPLVFLTFLLIANVTASIYLGKVVLRIFNGSLNIYLEFITGLLLIVLVKFLLLMIIPENGVILSLLVYMAFDAVINSIGIGILIDTKFGKAVESF